MKLWFCNFWGGWDWDNNKNYFTDVLTEANIDFEVTSNNPDLLIYSVFGQEHYRFNCKKIFYTGENIRPNFNECDYALSFDRNDHEKNHRLPLYAITEWNYKNLKNYTYQKKIEYKDKTVSFVQGNPNNLYRNDFYNFLSIKIKIDSGGRLFNNIGYNVEAPNKLEFLSNYNFNIAFENGSHPGYLTEKIYDSFMANSIPIYWGDPTAPMDFNEKSFINTHTYANFEDIAKYVVELNSNKDMYLEKLSEPMFINGVDNEYINKENIIKFFKKIT